MPKVMLLEKMPLTDSNTPYRPIADRRAMNDDMVVVVWFVSN